MIGLLHDQWSLYFGFISFSTSQWATNEFYYQCLNYLWSLTILRNSLNVKFNHLSDEKVFWSQSKIFLGILSSCPFLAWIIWPQKYSRISESQDTYLSRDRTCCNFDVERGALFDKLDKRTLVIAWFDCYIIMLIN